MTDFTKQITANDSPEDVAAMIWLNVLGAISNDAVKVDGMKLVAAAIDAYLAAREQHGQLQLLLTRVRDHVLPYADNDSTLRMDLNDIDAALSPSQPTPTQEKP